MLPVRAALAVTLVAAASSLIIGLTTLEAAQQTRTTFSVASVKVHAPGDPTSSMDNSIPNRYSAINIALDVLIVNAWDIPMWRLDGIQGRWATARFDVVATTDGPRTQAQKHLMLQRLLEDRFKLVLRRRETEGDVYVLLTDRADGRLGPNIKPSPDDCVKAAAIIGDAAPAQSAVPSETRQRCFSTSGGLGSGWNVKGASMAKLVSWLSTLSSQTILDQTNLKGVFDFQLRASLADLRPVAGAPPRTDTADLPPSIFAAFREQLGLKLERRRMPIERFVIEHVEMPTPD